ncbi:MAG: hypothetical protein WD185_05515, partial [Sneathiella sp.]
KKEALEILERNREFLELTAEGTIALAEALHRTGHTDDAIASLKSLLLRESGHPKAKKLISRLSKQGMIHEVPKTLISVKE